MRSVSWFRQVSAHSVLILEHLFVGLDVEVGLICRELGACKRARVFRNSPHLNCLADAGLGGVGALSELNQNLLVIAGAQGKLRLVDDFVDFADEGDWLADPLFGRTGLLDKSVLLALC